MVTQNIFHTTITKAFEPTWVQFNQIVDSDKQFQELVKEKCTRDARYSNDKLLASLKIRYAILFYVKSQRLKDNVNKPANQNE